MSGVTYNGPQGGYGGPFYPVGYTNAANMSLCVLDGQYIPAPNVTIVNGNWGTFTNITTDYAYQLSWQGTLKIMPGDAGGAYMPGVCNYPFNTDPWNTPLGVPTLMQQCLVEQNYVRGAMMRSLLYNQISISGQALVFVVRTADWSLLSRAGTLTYIAFILAQVGQANRYRV